MHALLGVNFAAMIRVLVLSLALPVFAQPFIGPERLISPYEPGAPRTTLRIGTSAAGNADGFYVAWTEYSDRDRVIGARLSREGKLIGMPQFVGDGGRATEVRWDGSRYIVTARNDLPPYTTSWAVSSNGIAPIAPQTTPLPVNASGEHMVQTWEDGVFTIWYVGADGALHGPPLRPQGVPQGAKIIYATSKDDDWLMLVLEDTTGYIRWVHVSRLSTESTVISPRMTWVNGNIPRRFSGIVVNGSTVSFAWDALRETDPAAYPEYQRMLGYTIVNMEFGTAVERVIDSTTMRFMPTAVKPSTFGAAATFNGREFVYAWTSWDANLTNELRVVYGTNTPRVLARSNGGVGFSFDPVLASAEGRDLLLWSPPGSRRDTVARLIDSASSVDDGVASTLVSAGVPAQSQPIVTTTANTTLTTWTEGDPPAVMGRILSNAGAGAPFKIADTSHPVAVAASANAYLVVWREINEFTETRVLVRRYEENGVAIDAAPLQVASGGYVWDPTVQSDGTDFVLMWRTWDNKVYVFRIPSRGAVTASPVKIADTAYARLYRAGGHFFVIWTETLDQTGYMLKGTRLADDTLAATNVVNMWLLVKSAGADQGLWSIAGNDKEFMVVLSAQLAGEQQKCVRVRRFGLDLVPLAPESERFDCQPGFVEWWASPPFSPHPIVVWDGEQWTAITGVRDTAYNGYFIPAWQFRRIGVDGKVHDPLTLDLARGNVLWVSLARTQHGVTLAYTHADDNAAGIFRAFLLPIAFEVPKGRAVRH